LAIRLRTHSVSRFGVEVGLDRLVNIVTEK